MINKPNSHIETLQTIGKNILYTAMLFSILQLNASFSETSHSGNDNKKTIENPIDLKGIYKANIGKSILDAKAFPIALSYTHEKELREGGFTLRRTVSFDQKMQAFVLTDDVGEEKRLCFRAKVPFAYNGDEIKQLYIKSFGFDPKVNKFTMQGVYKRDSKNPLKEVVGKIIVGSVVERNIPLQKIVMMETIVPGAQGEKKYEVKIPINNTAGDIVEATVIEYVPKKNK